MLSKKSKIRKCIYIPSNSKIQPYVVECQNNNFSQLLNTDYTDYRSIGWMDDNNYNLIIFCKDIYQTHEYNTLASIIGKIDLCEDCLLVDDNRDLDLDDLNQIIEFSKNFDYEKYQKQCDMYIKNFI